MSSRLLSNTLRTSSNLTKRALLNNSRVGVLSQVKNVTRTFTTTPVTLNKADKLQEVLSSELKICKAIPNELDSGYQDFLSSSGFKVISKDNFSNVELVKETSNGQIIHVFFDVDEISENPMVPEEENFEEEIDQYDSFLSFVKVVIEKPDNTALFFNLYLQGSDGSFMIDFVSFKQDAKTFLTENIANSGEFVDKFEYQGPKFSDLDESLQVEFEGYLTEQEINEDLADFIVAFSENKEETEYRNWLGKLVSFFK